MTTTTIRQAGDPLERATAFALAAVLFGLLVYGAWPALSDRAAQAQPLAQPVAKERVYVIITATPALATLSRESLQTVTTAAPAPTAPPVVAQQEAPAPVVEQEAAPVQPAIVAAPNTPEPAWLEKRPPPPQDSHGSRTNDHAAPPTDGVSTQTVAAPHAQAHPGDPPGGAPGTAPRRPQP